MFDGLARFDQPFTGITFARALMDAVPPHRDDEVQRALATVAQQRLLRATQASTYSARVRDHLIAQRAGVKANIAQAAQALGLSARSLRARLAAEGRTWNALVNEVSLLHARQLLEDLRRTIQEIAYELGFADASGFHRAWKRWTGQTPQAYLAGVHPRQERAAHSPR